MPKRMSATVCVAVFTAVLTAPAWAQQPCHNARQMAKHLADRYQELPTANGVQTDGRILKIYASPTGTWTAVVIDPSRGCIVASGDRWREVQAEVSVPKAERAGVAP